MALTSTMKQWFLKPMPGMAPKTEDLERVGKTVELAQNCRFEVEPGAVDKRQPITYFNTTTMGESNPVVGLHRYNTTDGTATLIAVHNQSVYKGSDTAGTFTALTLPQSYTLTADKRMAFTVYKDLLIMCNGADNVLVYDNSTDNVCWEMGACKAVLASGGSNLDSAAIYYYAVVFNTAADGSGTDYINGALSNPVTTDASNRKVSLSNIPLGPSDILSRVIYRVEGGGSALKLLAVITDNSTTTYTDDIADGSLGAAYGAVTDDMPKGNILQVHRERLFISGDPDEPNRIYFSEVYLPWYILQTTNTDYLDIEPDDGDEIRGIPLFMGTMSCIKQNTIRKLHITSAATGTDPNTWYADDPIAFTGSPAPWSIVMTQYGIMFLGWDHWYLWNGARLQPIIDEFDTAEILLSEYDNVTAYFVKNILYWTYTNESEANAYHDKVGRYNFLRKKLSVDTFIRNKDNAGNAAVTTTGVNCFTSLVGEDEASDIYYGDSRSGFVYRAETVELWAKWNKKSQVESNIERNLLSNTHMEFWTNGASSAPDDWTLAGASATIARDSTNYVGFTYGAKITRAGTNATLSQSMGAVGTIGAHTIYQGETVYVGGWVYLSGSADTARIQVDDGVGTSETSYHTGVAGWEWLGTTHAVDGSASELTVNLMVDNNNEAPTFDEVVFLYAGDDDFNSSDIIVGGTEDSGWIEVGRDEQIDEMNDTIDNQVGTIDMNDTDGAIVFAPQNIRAGTLTKLYWNIDKAHDDDTVSFWTRAGATKAACEAATWDGPLTSSGDDITSTPNVWVQIKLEMTANGTSTGSPRIYLSNGFIIKYSYRIGGGIAEETVEFDYDTGDRNYIAPFVDKIHKKIIIVHEGDTADGTYTMYWYTEHANGSRTVDFATYPERWESFVSDSMYGRDLRLRVYKNDLLNCRIKEIKGLYVEEPIIT